MNQFIIQYLLPDGTARQVVVDNCSNVMEAIEKFRVEYGEELVAQIIGVQPAGRL